MADDYAKVFGANDGVENDPNMAETNIIVRVGPVTHEEGIQAQVPGTCPTCGHIQKEENKEELNRGHDNIQRGRGTTKRGRGNNCHDRNNRGRGGANNRNRGRGNYNRGRPYRGRGNYNHRRGNDNRDERAELLFKFLRYL